MYGLLGERNADGTLRSARANQFARSSRYVRGAGVAETALMTGVGYANIYYGNPNALDWADASVGTLGLIAAGVAMLTPVGWVAAGVTAIGYEVAIYSGVRIGVDLYNDKR